MMWCILSIMIWGASVAAHDMVSVCNGTSRNAIVAYRLQQQACDYKIAVPRQTEKPIGRLRELTSLQYHIPLHTSDHLYDSASSVTESDALYRPRAHMHTGFSLPSQSSQAMFTTLPEAQYYVGTVKLTQYDKRMAPLWIVLKERDTHDPRARYYHEIH